MARAVGGRDGQVLVVRPERLRFADAGMPGTVKERRYTGAWAFYLVETDAGERFEVLADPRAARVGERVYVEAVRAIPFAAPSRAGGGRGGGGGGRPRRGRRFGR